MKTELRTIGDYRREITPALGPEVFQPNPWRLLWFSVCVGLSLPSFFAIALLDLAWPIKFFLGVVIGVANGIMGFTTHELLHGAVVKNEKLQNFLGFFGLLPALISPTFWKFVHNYLHHGKTQQVIFDPDAFPTIEIYKSSKFAQMIFPFTPGSGRKRSYFYFFYWLSFQEFTAQVYVRFRNQVFGSLNHTRVTAELSMQILIILTMLWFAGFENWLWVLLVPLAIQNYMLMSHISTNHGLSPLTNQNDALVNSLTVTNHPVFEFFSLNFGYHVEHHLFPTVSGKYAKRIHRVLREKYPETYKCMPKWDAMKALYSTARIYKDPTTLIHPESLKTFDTI